MERGSVVDAQVEAEECRLKIMALSAMYQDQIHTAWLKVQSIIREAKKKHT